MLRAGLLSVVLAAGFLPVVACAQGIGGRHVAIPDATSGSGKDATPTGPDGVRADQIDDVRIVLDQQRAGRGVVLAGERPGEAVEQDLPDGPGELSFGHHASSVSGPVGSVTTWQVPTRRRYFSIRHARSVFVRFFVETTE